MRERRRVEELAKIEQLLKLERKSAETTLLEAARAENEREQTERAAERQLQRSFDHWTLHLQTRLDPHFLAGLASSTRQRETQLETASALHKEAVEASALSRAAFAVSAAKLKHCTEATRLARRRLARLADEKQAHRVAERATYVRLIK